MSSKQNEQINKTNPTGQNQADPTSQILPYPILLNQTDRLKEIAGLDAITEYAVNKLSECPSFFHEQEKAFNEKVLDYGLNLIDQCGVIHA